MIAGLKAAVREQVRALSARLQQTTPRERALLGVLLLGALVILPLAAADWRVGQEDRYVEALEDRAQARRTADAAKRIRTALDDKLALEDMETWGFKASNVDVARVMIEDALARAARETELTQVTIATDNEIEAIGPTDWLGAEVQADLRWSTLFNFLDRVAAMPQGFRVVAFSYELTAQPMRAQSTPDQFTPISGKVRVKLAFPVVLPADPEAREPADRLNGTGVGGRR